MYLFCRNLVPFISRLSYQLKLLHIYLRKSFCWIRNAAHHCNFICWSLIFSFLNFCIHFLELSYTYALELYAELQRVKEVSSCTCFGLLNLFIFIASHHIYSHVICWHLRFELFWLSLISKGTTSFSTECNDGCVVKCGIHSL